MAYNLSKLISDIKQTFIKQALQLGRLTKVTPPQNQAITLLSIDLSNAIDAYVKEGEISLSLANTYQIASGARTYWLNSSGREIYNLYSTNKLDFESPSDANTIISAVNYTRTISVTSVGAGDVLSRIFLDINNNGNWFLASRATTYNTAYTIIPANTRAALSMINASSANIQVNISILKAGKNS